jgi:hypothetical protein
MVYWACFYEFGGFIGHCQGQVALLIRIQYHHFFGRLGLTLGLEPHFCVGYTGKKPCGGPI